MAFVPGEALALRSMHDPPLISIVVLSLNGADVIRGCLDSVLLSDWPNLEVLVVNNGSTDDTPRIVREAYPSVRLIDLPRNLGFAGGMNEGLKAARGEILVPLNDDTLVDPAMAREIARPIVEDAAIGMVGCKILYPDGKTIQHAGGIIKPNGLTDHFGYGMPDDGQWDDEREVDYVTGCAMAIPRRAFERIGLFDDRYYPTYYEEVEFAIRLRKAGFRIVYNPKAVLRHLESKTEVRYSPRFFTRFHRSRMRLLLKNYSAAQLARAAWCEAKWIVFGLDWTWRKALFLPLLRAYIYSLLHLPWILHDRYYRFLPIGGPPTAETGKTSDAGPRRQAV